MSQHPGFAGLVLSGFAGLVLPGFAGLVLVSLWGCGAADNPPVVPAAAAESPPKAVVMAEPSGEGPITVGADGVVEFHLAKNPTPDQLVKLGDAMAAIERMSVGERARKLRRASVQLLKGTAVPVTVHACGDLLFAGLVKDGYLKFPMLYEQYLVSAGAATLRRGGASDDAIGIEEDAVLGTLRLYESALAEGVPNVRHPHLDELVQLRDAGKLHALVEENHCQNK